MKFTKVRVKRGKKDEEVLGDGYRGGFLEKGGNVVLER